MGGEGNGDCLDLIVFRFVKEFQLQKQKKTNCLDQKNKLVCVVLKVLTLQNEELLNEQKIELINKKYCIKRPIRKKIISCITTIDLFILFRTILYQ